ncbi:MAG: HD domain-containing protein [Nitriliruptoraceae bacterium]|nr:HD domain-containing protein [Nitriliruptoraceae bacterium]
MSLTANVHQSIEVAMYQQSVERVTPGAVLGRTIIGPDGTPLLRAGAVLSAAYLRSLRSRGYKTVYVRDGLADDVVPDDLVSQRVRTTISDHISGAFAQVALVACERGIGQGTMDDAERQLGQETLPVDDGDALMAQLYADVEQLITELLESDTVAGLESLRSHNEYTFQHSVDVAIIGVLLGKQLRMPRTRLRDLALGCLLHDLGKVYIDQAILDKPGALDEAEFELIQQHPRMGFELIRRLPVASMLPAHVAYQHHERQNGRGYPRGLIGGSPVGARVVDEQIGSRQMLLIAEIGAVADVYSALAADRPYRSALTPDAIITTMSEMAGPHLNRDLVRTLRQLVPAFPVGRWIEVTGGEFRGCRGIVTDLHLADLEHPQVRLHIGADGEALRDPVELDTRRAHDLTLRCLQAHESPTDEQMVVLEIA